MRILQFSMKFWTFESYREKKQFDQSGSVLSQTQMVHTSLPQLTTNKKINIVLVPNIWINIKYINVKEAVQ